MDTHTYTPVMLTHTHTHPYRYSHPHIHTLCLYTYILIFNQIPPYERDVTQNQFFKLNLSDLNSEPSFSYIGYHTKVKEPSLAYYLCIAGERIIGFILFLRVLALRKIQTASSRILILSHHISCPAGHIA